MNSEAEALTGWAAEAASGRALAEVFQIDGGALLTRDRRNVPIAGRAEAVRDFRGRLREIRLHFSRQTNPPPLNAA